MHARLSLLPLQLDDVGYSMNGERLISGITLRFELGRPTLVLGPNGAGKSLLLRLCHGLIQPSTGKVSWLGPAGRNPQSRRFGQAMVFQKPVLLRRSVLENAEFPLKLRGLNAAARHDKAMAALDRVGLAALAQRPARVLSGGEQQRLALARACSIGAADPVSRRAVSGARSRRDAPGGRHHRKHRRRWHQDRDDHA